MQDVDKMYLTMYLTHPFIFVYQPPDGVGVCHEPS